MAENPEYVVGNEDFARGLYVCEKPGLEFASVGSAGMSVQLVASQGFAMLFLVPVLTFFGLRNVLGVSGWIAWVAAGLMGAVLLVLGVSWLMRINKGHRKHGAFLKNESDSRFRVRAVIPKKRQNLRILRWAQMAASGEAGAVEAITQDELQMVRGGFDPIIIRPWFGIKRNKQYWWTFAVMSVVVGASAIYGLTFFFGGWKGLMQSFGFMGYALTGLALVGGAIGSELLWPVYVRLVPGQIDIFRYGFLGSGGAKVESFDLHTVGVCVDFGGYVVSLEPAREVGSPLPELVGVNGLVYRKEFPVDYQPTYFSAALVRDRREFAQRLIQAARTDEPTPPVSMTLLGE